MEARSGLWRRSQKKRRHHARAPETRSRLVAHPLRDMATLRTQASKGEACALSMRCPSGVHPLSILLPFLSILAFSGWKNVGIRAHLEACALSFRCPSCVHPLSIPCPSCSFSVHPAHSGVEKRGKSCPSCATEWPLYNIKRGEGSTAPAWRPPRRPHGSPTCGPSRILPPGQIEREFRPRLIQTGAKFSFDSRGAAS